MSNAHIGHTKDSLNPSSAARSNPYVERIVVSMPTGPSIEDIPLGDKQTAKRTKLREEKQKALDRAVQQVEDIIDGSQD